VIRLAMTVSNVSAYRNAQSALAESKSAACEALAGSDWGLSNAELGRARGIYPLHVVMTHPAYNCSRA